MNNLPVVPYVRVGQRGLLDDISQFQDLCISNNLMSALKELKALHAMKGKRFCSLLGFDTNGRKTIVKDKSRKTMSKREAGFKKLQRRLNGLLAERGEDI